LTHSTAELAAHILRLCRERVHSANGPGLIAITGPSCSGKSLLARQLGWHARSLGFEVTLHHLSEYVRPHEGFTDGGSADRFYYEQGFDDDAFVQAVHADAATRRDGTRGYVIADGEFLLKTKFRKLWDFSVLIEADDDLLIKRACEIKLDGVNAAEIEALRTVEGVETVFNTYCLPADRLHQRLDKPCRHASLVVESLADGWALQGAVTEACAAND
jgi:hypothetical protein